VKLGAGFGALIVLLVVIAFVGLSRLGAVNANSEFLAKKSLPSVELIDSVDSGVEAYHGVQLEHVTADDKGEFEELDGELVAERETIEKAFTHYRPMVVDATDRALLEQTAAKWRSYVQQTNGIETYSEAGNREAADDVLDSGDALYYEILATVAK
jgi:hypothetical protein